MLDMWTPLEVEYIERSFKSKYDCSGFNQGAFIFNQKTVKALQPVLEGKVEVLPLVHIGTPTPDHIFAINVVNLLDCLDYEKAKVKIDKEYNVVTKVLQYAFQIEMVIDESIFKMPQHRGTRIFVTEKFVQAVQENQITGLDFEEVWDSEEDLTVERTIPIPQFEGETYTFTEALKILDEGFAVASKHFKVQMEGNEMIIGMMDISGQYHWGGAYGFPPYFLEMTWYKVERSAIKKVSPQ